MNGAVKIDLDKPLPIPDRNTDVRKPRTWRERWVEREKKKLMKDAVNVLKFLKKIMSQTQDDPILIKRSRIVEAIKEPTDRGTTDLQDRADLAMRNFGFEKSWNPESRSIFYMVPRQMVKELCEAYAADLRCGL